MFRILTLLFLGLVLVSPIYAEGTHDASGGVRAEDRRTAREVLEHNLRRTGKLGALSKFYEALKDEFTKEETARWQELVKANADLQRRTVEMSRQGKSAEMVKAWNQIEVNQWEIRALYTRVAARAGYTVRGGELSDLVISKDGRDLVEVGIDRNSGALDAVVGDWVNVFSRAEVDRLFPGIRREVPPFRFSGTYSWAPGAREGVLGFGRRRSVESYLALLEGMRGGK